MISPKPKSTPRSNGKEGKEESRGTKREKAEGSVLLGAQPLGHAQRVDSFGFLWDNLDTSG